MPTLNLIETLTDREKEIYAMLCNNRSNDDIAEELCMSVRGVVWNLSRIYKKLGVSSENKSDLHLCRQRAISYGGTKIVETIEPKSVGYTREEILDAVKQLTWYDSVRVREIVTDLLREIDTDKRFAKTHA